jgi:hypothetical protein
MKTFKAFDATLIGIAIFCIFKSHYQQLNHDIEWHNLQLLSIPLTSILYVVGKGEPHSAVEFIIEYDGSYVRYFDSQSCEIQYPSNHSIAGDNETEISYAYDEDKF